MEVLMMELGMVKVHETKGSCFVYIPKVWVKKMDLKKGDKVAWSIEEGDHKTLKLKKINTGG